jgi:uncharacterized sporulation protein YeaH/YhbH (DUF444 family)
MFDRMSPQQLAKAKGQASTTNHIRALATAANGHGSTRQQQRKAEAELERALGSRRAKKAKEDALRSAGARPKGLGRFFG